MFLLRSAFWLTVAFLLIRPGVDLERTASGISASALAAGQAFVAQQLQGASCSGQPCAGAGAAITVALSSIPSAGATMQAPANGPVPFPRPRPAWMG